MSALGHQNEEARPAVPLRPAEEVMRLERLGSFFATRLSFMPSLIRNMAAEGWRFSRPLFELNDRGEGMRPSRFMTANRTKRS